MKKLMVVTILVTLLLVPVSCNTIETVPGTENGEIPLTQAEEDGELPSGSASEKYAELAEKYKDNPELFDKAVYAAEQGISIDDAISDLIPENSNTLT